MGKPEAIASLLKTLKEISYSRINELLNILSPEKLAENISYSKELINTLEDLNYPHIQRLKELLI